MFTELKTEVCRVNKALVDSGLVILTWGNVSGVDRKAGVMAIKPSGVPYDKLTPDDIVVLKIADGTVLEGKYRPSSDTATHLHLYRAFPNIGGVVHTHSVHATAFAQAQRAISCQGTTHADHFYGSVPVTRHLTPEEINGEYELNTGKVIAETFATLGINADDVPAALVAGHAPFVWGNSGKKALENAVALEAIAQMQLAMLQLHPGIGPLPQVLQDKHFKRKHGPGAYYGQENRKS